MKKKSLVVGMVLAMAFGTLTACGNAKKDYMNDVQEINDFGDAFEESEDADAYKKSVDEMDMKTKEGKEIKKDMEEVGKYMEKLADVLENAADYDQEDGEKIQKEAQDLSKKIEDDVKAFTDAAEKSGVDEKDLKDLGIDL